MEQTGPPDGSMKRNSKGRRKPSQVPRLRPMVAARTWARDSDEGRIRGGRAERRHRAAAM